MSSYVYNNNLKTGSDSNCYEIAGKTRAGSTSYDPDTGAYNQHIDYDDTDGTRRHHREHMDAVGRYYHRDVDRDTSKNGSEVRVQKDYVNPNTGTSYHRETEYDIRHE
ncbi:hypothetical protein V8E54_003918 [Elaphomyces granulatus]